MASAAALWLTASAVVMWPAGGLAAPLPRPRSAGELWTEQYIGYGDAIDFDFDDGDFGPPGSEYNRTDDRRQHLHLLRHPNAPGPAPVYIYAHANGGTAWLLQDSFKRSVVAEAGYALISWESVTTLDGAEDSEVCMTDLDLVLQWARDHSAEHGLDMSRVVLGGRSRGSACTWPAAHSGDPTIKGIYMYNALPDPAWANLTAWDPAEEVKASSPPILLTYGPGCPTDPPQAGCDVDGDIHNPHNGQIIVDKYGELGMASNARLIQGMADDSGNVGNIAVYFPAFTQALATLEP